jgi:FkbH-like protein
MSTASLQSWREPCVADWREQARRVAEDVRARRLDTVGGRLRRLAGMRLGDGERVQMRRLVCLIRSLPELPAGLVRYRLLLVSNRTVSFLAADLEAAGAARGLVVEAVETAYDSVSALAFDSSSPAPDGAFDAVLLLVDADFFAPPAVLLDSTAEAEALAAARARLDAVAAGLRGRMGAPVIAATIPLSPEADVSSAELSFPGTLARLVRGLNEAIACAAAEGRLVPFDLAALASRIGTVTYFDPVRFHQAKLPFSLDAGPVVADALAALIAAMAGRAGRALVLDLDNTLWGGVIADEGLEHVALGQGSPEGEAFLAIQRYALELRRRGVVLAVCSKNLEAMAREPFSRHPDMLIRDEHIAVFVANMEDKASNLVRIAGALDLDVSSLVFLDDNPAERERVRSALPFVMVPELGDDPACFVRAVASSGFFEHLPLTRDDAQRAAAYRARAEVEALRGAVGDYGAFLRSLGMELSIAPFDAVGRARITQLIQKSNQFNLTTRRYSEVEVEAIERDPRRLAWQVRLVDRFGDHGMVCAVIVDRSEDAWSIDTWVMSCRVLQRGVEHAVMQELAERAAACGARALAGTFRPTARNALVKDFYPRLGFTPTAESNGAVTYRLPLPATIAGPGPMRVTFATGA